MSRPFGNRFAHQLFNVYQLDVVSLRAARVARAETRTFPRIAPTVWLLGVVSFFTDVSSEMVSSILPIYLLLHLQLTPVEFGFVDGLYYGVTALARLSSGLVADRFRRYKPMAAVGYGLSAICKLGLLAAGSAWGALATVISLDRVGKGIRTAPRDAMISMCAQEGDLAATFGVHRALDTAGVVVGPLMAYLILGLVPGGFDSIFVVSFAVAIVGVGLLVLLVREPAQRDGVTQPPSFRATLALAFDRRLRFVTLIGTLLSLTVMSDAFLYLMLQRRANVAAETLPLLFIGTSVAFLLLAVPFGRLADGFGRARVFIGGHVAITMVYGIAVFAGNLGVIGLIICLALHGAFYASTDGVLPALASGLIPSELRASGLAAIATTTSLAKLVGSVLFGAIWSWGGPTYVLFIACGATAMASTWAALTLRAMRPHAPTAQA